MIDGANLISESIPDQDKAIELMERLVAVADAKSVFSEPVQSGEFTLITASDLRVAMGFGFGGGGGADTSKAESKPEEESSPAVGYGGGGGGGGASMGRPVAAIEIGPQGVRVEPIVDPTKIAIAFFTTLISIFAMMGKMRRAIRK